MSLGSASRTLTPLPFTTSDCQFEFLLVPLDCPVTGYVAPVPSNPEVRFRFRFQDATTLFPSPSVLGLSFAMVYFSTDFRICSLLALSLQSMLYGIYLITSGSCAVALTRVNGRWRSRREMQLPFLFAGLFLFLNMTCGLCIQFYSCLALFVHGGSDGSGFPNTFSHSSMIQVRYIPRWC